MLVKVLATEPDFNFINVRGAELISMYIDELNEQRGAIFNALTPGLDL